MLTTKKYTRLLIVAIATTVLTLALCTYSVYCSYQTQHHSWLQRLLASTNAMFLLIVSQLLSLVFLLLSVCLYCRQSSVKKTEHKNWTRELNQLMMNPNASRKPDNRIEN